MKLARYQWVLGLGATLALVAVPLVVFLPRAEPRIDEPARGVPMRKPHTDHTALLTGPYDSGSEVTQACLECHPQAAEEMMGTVHWTWESEPYILPGRDQPVTIGKKNQLNNFCIGVQSNWEGCTTCHAGYGWDDADFDFEAQENVDCLVCHDTTGTYVKGTAGLPVEGVDLVYVAGHVGYTSRKSCGTCHFEGGGGEGVKHGDLDGSLIHPPAAVDVHMGESEFVCTDCHWTEDHVIAGRAISVSLDRENQVECTNCHAGRPHEDDRLNAHTSAVACQTCHIPAAALRDPTKMYWDWSTAGQDRPENHYTYLKIKGSFVYESDIIPEYRWYDGVADRYLLGDPIDPGAVTILNPLAGSIDDPDARIFPFKIHTAKQPYDVVYRYLLQPKTVGEDGFWEDFDWDQAFRLGSLATGFPYSGQYGFAETEMFWPITHMVAPADQALVCADCHSEEGRLDWQALGYPGDPIEWGGRIQLGDVLGMDVP
jgi:octaheme c-type cytochrome (tetrathionate reductase family)